MDYFELAKDIVSTHKIANDLNLDALQTLQELARCKGISTVCCECKEILTFDELRGAIEENVRYTPCDDCCADWVNWIERKNEREG